MVKKLNIIKKIYIFFFPRQICNVQYKAVISRADNIIIIFLQIGYVPGTKNNISPRIRPPGLLYSTV